MLNRVFHYALPHTRVRARIGASPTPAQWQHIAAARDLDAMVQRMRENGLARWVGTLPRAPSAPAIEKALAEQALVLAAETTRWLPARWRECRRWLWSGVLLLLIRDLLQDPAFEPPDGSPDMIHRIAALPPAQRRDALQAAGYARYLDPDHAQSLDRWLAAFGDACPAPRGREGYIVHRVRKLLRDHQDRLRDARGAARQGEPDHPPGEAIQWRLREQLTQGLRALLGYESFHAGLLFTYLLLELLQAERCRALLLARVHGWDAAGVVL